MANCLRFLFILFLIAAANNIIAQPSLQKMQRKLASEKQNVAQPYYRLQLNEKTPAQASLLFSSDINLQKDNLQSWLTDKLELRAGVDAFVEKQRPVDYFGSQVHKLQQYFKGIKVEHGVISQVVVNNSVRLLQFEFYSIPDNLVVTPAVSEEAALQKAMRFVGASKYVWEGYKGTDAEYTKPKAELVIVEDMKNAGRMCMAYKFNIYAAQPLNRQYVYVDAKDGRIVFYDMIIKHLDGDRKMSAGRKLYDGNAVKTIPQNYVQQNMSVVKPSPVFGTGYALYSGVQFFSAEEVAPGQNRLMGHTQANNTEFWTANANHKTAPLSPADVTEFIDADADWGETEYTDTTSAAVAVHWGTEKILDYWWETHARKSLDNDNMGVASCVHYDQRYPNAFWNGSAIFYGDGTQDAAYMNAVVSIDISAHELGHAICQFTSNLVYKRESGALNEGFSDIWGACIDNYINKNFAGFNKKPFLIGDEIMQNGREALRDLAAPTNFLQPDTYQDIQGNWFDANVENCPVPIHSDSAFGNDFCGVHDNSGVLNKWFYLITNGEQGFMNGFGETYDIDSMGFDKTERIAYYTEMILTPNSGYEAARIASLNAVLVLASSPNTLGITAADTININKAWKAVGVTTDSIYNIANTPIFASNAFTSIGVGQRGYIWAGTSNNGLYKYNGREWQKAGVLLNHNIAQILPDRDGGIWIAQYGRTGTQALSGGIGYFPDTSFSTFQMFANSDGVPTRNIKSIFINNELSFVHKYQRVWAACFADVTSGNNRPGAVTRGLETPVPPQTFDKIESGVYQVNGFCQTIGGNKDEVWVYANSNTSTGLSQLLRYRTSDTTFLGFIDNSNTPVLTTNFVAKAIYYDDVKQRWWIGLQNGGMLVRDSVTHSWMTVNFPAIFPAGTIVSNNAITGDTRGNIYIGTNNGYIFFGTPGANNPLLNPLDESLYKRYTRAADGLPSDTVRAIAIDYRAGRLLLATENGIAFRYTLCKECINTGPVYTITPGNWSNPGIWAGGKAPGLNSNVIVRHAVTVTEDANCNSLKTQNGGSVTVNTGVNLNIESAENPANVH